MAKIQLTIVLAFALSCDEGSVPVPGQNELPMHVDSSLASAREDEKLAEDVERALAERWPEIAEVVRASAFPLVSLEDVLRERGLPDPQGGLPAGAFGAAATRQRYFAAVLLGQNSEPVALQVVARVESQRLSSLNDVRAELPDVEQRLTVDRLARASSDRLNGFCQRLSELGASCSEGLQERNMSTREQPRGPNS